MFTRGPRGTRPRWPWAINRDSAQARGLLAWWPCCDFDPNRMELVRNEVFDLPSTGYSSRGGEAHSQIVDLALNFFPLSSEASYYTAKAGSTLSTLVSGGSEATASAWVKNSIATPSDPNLSGFPFAFDGDAANASHYPYIDGTIYTSCFLTARVSGSPVSGIDRAQWHLLTIRYKNATNGWALFQNGQQAFAATPGNATPDISQRQWIGGGGSTFPFHGQLTDVRIYNRWLTDAEVWALYDARTRWELYAQTPAIAFIIGPPSTAQHARPDSDLAAGTWTPSTGVNLYATIDEVTADDADYDRSGGPRPSADTMRVTLSDVSAPASGTSTIRIRGRTP